MTSYVKVGTWYEFSFQNVHQILINNFTCDKNFIKTLLKGSKWQKEYQKVAFFCISLIRHPYKGRFAKTWLTTPSTWLHMSKTRFFWTPRPICWLLNKSQLSPPRFFLNKGGIFEYWWMWPHPPPNNQLLAFFPLSTAADYHAVLVWQTRLVDSSVLCRSYSAGLIIFFTKAKLSQVKLCL